MRTDQLQSRISARWDAVRKRRETGRYRVPQHIAELLVALAAPQPSDIVCDPAAGTADLLSAAADYVRENFPASLDAVEQREHFRLRMFHGFEPDQAMLRVGRMNMRSHGVEGAKICAFDLIANELAASEAAYTLVLCGMPFAGSSDYANTARALLKVVRTKRLELLFCTRVLQLLQAGGRAALLVPESLLAGATKPHQSLRSKLVEEQQVQAVIRLPAGAFKPYTDASAAMLIFTKTDSGGADHVWFYDLSAGDATAPDLLARWGGLSSPSPSAEFDRPRSAHSFCVAKNEIAAQGYDLSLNRYQLPPPTQFEQRRPHEILAELAGLEAEIFQGMKDLVGMLK
jgi:type I restriction enzyme M protein